MYRAVLAAAIACVALVAPNAASAAGLTVTPVAPANGSTYTAGLDKDRLTPRFIYEVDWPKVRGPSLFYEVGTRTTLGPDGTIANEFVVSDGELRVENRAAPTRYTDSGFAEWMTKPGSGPARAGSAPGRKRGFVLPLSRAGHRVVKRALRAGQRPRVRLSLAVYKPNNDMFEPFEATFRLYG
ncbi:hypothetical protein DVA67_028400 [Solirubrobacter sp. CPCC 204708]|uniref:Uncharacterized protein n=1 Tax=Solirubrobacter deserti TaxID=2282478 RepID=A0ABT4RPK5_9ACTN|nr:hypothetical protein [Solirubrobacter deserti]MBE2319920.1 hypothetical protein [Solirubrobacter deserti]MDA0140486.1 hypothetical protein [Solirubrobacter deserti]